MQHLSFVRAGRVWGDGLRRQEEDRRIVGHLEGTKERTAQAAADIFPDGRIFGRIKTDLEVDQPPFSEFAKSGHVLFPPALFIQYETFSTLEELTKASYGWINSLDELRQRFEEGLIHISAWNKNTESFQELVSFDDLVSSEMKCSYEGLMATRPFCIGFGHDTTNPWLALIHSKRVINV